MIGRWRALRELGVMGINRRNAGYVLSYNSRRYYPLADDKLRTKALAMEAGIAVPELYGVIATQHDIKRLPQLLEQRGDFVVKPANGSGGNGIMVIARVGETWRRHDGTIIDLGEMSHHLSNVLSGQYSLGGQPDRAMIEYRVRFAPLFQRISYQGVPDIRIIVFVGYPVMAMVRLPTRGSSGKANLHQGAIGVGIDIATGQTLRGVSGTSIVDAHPDTLNPVSGVEVPDWERMLELAARCYELTRLGYLGVDIVLDNDLGPLILELNARPGLSIQLANRTGLSRRLERIEALTETDRTPRERVAFAREAFPAASRLTE